jgi:hypothetical protein
VIPVVHQRDVAESARTADDLGVGRPAQGGRAALAFIHALASEWRHASTLPEPDRRLGDWAPARLVSYSRW